MTLTRPEFAWRLVTAAGRNAAARLRRPRFPREAERLLDPFATLEAPPAAAYDGLVSYFAQGWVTYRDASGAGAGFPGWPSWSGEQVDRIEGFARIMPLFAAWCGAGRSPTVPLPTGGEISLPDEFAGGLVAGTDPDSASWWGAMPGKSNQRIVEAADIALALWLMRKSVWDNLPPARQEAVVAWLAQAGEAPGLDNNWHLFFVLIDRVLDALGHPGAIPDARERFRRIESFHLGDGWFHDGHHGAGHVDFYNAWGFHYALSWIDRIDPAWAPGFIAETQRAFLTTYPLLIAPQGLPILGRSAIYRMAAPAPLVFGQERHPDLISPGHARRALDAVWTHFVRHGAIARGAVTQGYHGADPRIVDNYSGPASPLWSLRSLVAAFSLPENAPFWTATPEPLWVERGSYERAIDGPGWLVHGDEATGAVTVEVLENPEGAAPTLEPFSLKQRLRSLVYERPLRPNNERAKYGRRYYRSDTPYCVE